MRHGRLEQSLVVSPGLDELFVQLSEVICLVLAQSLQGKGKKTGSIIIPFFCEYFSISLMSLGRIAKVWW
jgi:hypothetical protein